jgi:hypothetical protein
MCAITDKLFHFLGKLFRRASDNDQQTPQKVEELTSRSSSPAHPDSGRDTGAATRVR